MKKVGILTSGGDSPGMNAALRACVRTAITAGLEVVGFEDGYRGLIDNRFEELDAGSVSDVMDHGGTFLGSGRSEEFKSDEGLSQAAAIYEKHKLDGLIVVGGGGSMRGAHALVEHGLTCVGVPATIDNDLAGTDYCIGFDTALNTIITDVSKIRDTASAMDRVFVVEVMGRESGMLALYAGLASGADAVAIPEVPFDFGKCASDVADHSRRHKVHFLVIVAEGAGGAAGIADKLSKETGLEARVSVLGYIQRGGSPSGLDRVLASRLGAGAVDLLIAGENDCMAGVLGEDVVTVRLAEATASRSQIDMKMYELIQTLAN